MGDIKKQSISNAVLSYTGALVGYLIVYLQPHIISSSDIGLLRLLYSFSFITATLMPLGLGNFMLRYFPKIKDEKSGHQGLFFLIVTVTSLGALLVFVVLYFNKGFFGQYYKNSPEVIDYYYTSIFVGYAIALNLVLTIYSNCLLKTSYMVFLNEIFVRLAQLLVLVFFYMGWIHKQALIVGSLSVYFVQLLLIILYLFRLRVVTFKINWLFFRQLGLKDILLTSLLMTITGFVSLSARFIDQLQVGHFLNQKEVGIYSTCVLIAVLLEVPLRSMERIAQPKLSLFWMHKNHPEIESVYEKSSRYMFYLGAVLFCLLFANIDLLFLFLPPEFTAGKMSLIFVALSALINLLSGLNSAIIVISHKYYILSIGLVFQIVLAMLCNNLLIPLYGITGAAISTLIAFASFNGLMSLYNFIRFKIHPFSKYTLLIGCCLALNLLLVYVIPDTLNLWIKGILCSLVILGSFAFISLRFNIIPEISGVLKKAGILRN